MIPKEVIMIKLTRLNGKEFIVNSDLIEFIEATPDTVITLVNDKKIIVSEEIDTVVNKIVAYKNKTGILPNCGAVYREEV